MSYQIQNPILPGFYPDPSICRVGDTFYLACSSFSYFPGVPLFRSRDLAHWEPLGYALDDPADLRLSPDKQSDGICAPTLRYHDGKFYVIVFNFSTKQTLLACAEDPAGHWQVRTIEGTCYDPSLFWDVDGTCWCSYTRNFDNGDIAIVHRQLDLTTFELVGEERFLWRGAAAHALSPEASHMYYKDGFYYLMISEGGTEHYHAVCVARSRNIHGPYISYYGNPILTHRHLSMYYPICNIGHADIVDTPNGDWYMVVLGSRLYGGYHKNLGRETFICPVIWESGWPVAAPETGKVEFTYPAPAGLTAYHMAELPVRDDFDAPSLNWQWNYLGTPDNSPARLADGKLYIKAVSDPIWQNAAMRAKCTEAGASRQINVRALGFVGRRQQHPSYNATVKMEFTPGETETAGLVIVQEKYNQLRIEMGRESGRQVIRVVRFAEIPKNPHIGILLPELSVREEHSETVLGVLPWEHHQAVLRIDTNGQSNSFYAGTDEQHLIPVALNADGSFMGSETVGGFIGTFIAMFCSANGAKSSNEAAFDWFDYCGK